MSRLHQALALLAITFLLSAIGCIRRTITDTRIEEAVQAFLDAPPNPSDEFSLTAEERAAIESFRVFHFTIKVQLVKGTDGTMWELIGKKMTRAFALACRGVSQFESFYYGEVWILADVERREDNFKVGEFRFQNASERIYVEMYNPSRSRN